MKVSLVMGIPEVSTPADQSILKVTSRFCPVAREGVSLEMGWYQVTGLESALKKSWL
jgi:hypothetical protein